MEFFPGNLFQSSWISEDLAHEFKAENKLRTVLQIFSLLIVFLSCLGLFGLITFMVQNRTKEISIRKVLGASVAQIVHIFFKRFTETHFAFRSISDSARLVFTGQMAIRLPISSRNWTFGFCPKCAGSYDSRHDDDWSAHCTSSF